MNIALQFKALYYPLRRLFGPVTVTDDFGIKVRWYPYDKVPIKKLITRENYKHEFSQYDRYARGVVIDVGANIGVHCVYLSRLAEKVIAIEPVRSTFEKLQETLLINGVKNVLPLQIGVGEKSEKMEMKVFPPERSSWNSMYAPKGQEGKPVATEVVAIMPLDELAEVHRLETIDFVKIDVEGHELPVLKGATKLLKEKRIRALSFEVTQMHAYDAEEIFALLRNHGYKVEDYMPEEPHHNYYAVV